MNDCDHTCKGLREEIRRLSEYTTNMNYDAKCVFTEKSVVGEDEAIFRISFWFRDSGKRVIERGDSIFA